MKRLPHWCITDIFPALYDTESATAIEQTAKLYGAMNELIDDYNAFVDRINEEIEAFETSTNKNYELFTISMRQEFQDFINTIELKVKAQDKAIVDKFNAQDTTIANSIKAQDTKIANSINQQNAIIADAVAYMKTELRATITALIEEMRENGQLSEDILKAFDEYIVYVTPEMFGAVGDGVTDDTTALQEAFTHRNVVLTQKYLVSSPIVAGEDFRTLQGNGSVVILAEKSETDTGTAFLTVLNTNNILIENVTIEATKNLDATDIPAGQAMEGEKESRWHGIRLWHCSDAIVRNVDMTNLTYGIHISKGDYEELKEECNRNIVLDNIHSYNCKTHIFVAYCTKLHINNTVHVIDEAVSLGFHTYYLEAYIGDVIINGDFIDISNAYYQYTPYDFASYGGEETNENRHIIVSDFVCKGGGQMYTVANSPKFIKFLNGLYEQRTTSHNCPVGYYHQFNGKLEFEGCTIKCETLKGMIEGGFVTKPTKPIVYKNCNILGIRPVPYWWNFNHKPFSNIEFKNCYIEPLANEGGVCVPCHGEAKFDNCHFYGNIGYSNCFITAQNPSVEDVDGKLHFNNCKFETTSDAYFTGEGVIGETYFNNCQLITTAVSSASRFFITAPTKDVNTVVNYMAV